MCLEALASVGGMTTNHINALAITTLHVLDQDEAVAFYRDHLGFEVSNDVDLGFMRWLTIRPVEGRGSEVLLSLPGEPAHDAETAGQLRNLVAKGALGGLFLYSDDIHATYRALEAAGVEITQEPVAQPYGTDIGIRDPFGNHVRITQPGPVSDEPGR